MEYCPGGDLYSVLQNIGRLPEDKAKIYTAEVVEALNFLRSNNVIHRDLKPDNILVSKNGHLKLADFGMSVSGIIDRSISSSPGPGMGDHSTSNATSNPEEIEKNIIGTPDYIAPEIIMQKAHYFTADYWSLGCIVYELLTGIPPFHGETPEITFANIIKGNYNSNELQGFSPQVVDFIKRLLCPNPRHRLGFRNINELKNHPWFHGINWNSLFDLEPPFIPVLDNDEDTSYFEERYELTHDDESDILLDIQEAIKQNEAKKITPKSSSFFNEDNICMKQNNSNQSLDSDDDLSQFPSCSSESLHNLTIEESQKKINIHRSKSFFSNKFPNAHSKTDSSLIESKSFNGLNQLSKVDSISSPEQQKLLSKLDQPGLKKQGNKAQPTKKKDGNGPLRLFHQHSKDSLLKK